MEGERTETPCFNLISARGSKKGGKEDRVKMKPYFTLGKTREEEEKKQEGG